MLREWNKRYGTIKFVDISSEEYSPEENQGLDYETVSLGSNFIAFLVNLKGLLRFVRMNVVISCFTYSMIWSQMGKKF